MVKKVKGKYYVSVERVRVRETGIAYEYGAEFPDLNDEERMELLLSRNILSLTPPPNIPEKAGVPEINQFAPSESQKEPDVDKKKKDKKE